jgi:hypothetical protein
MGPRVGQDAVEKSEISLDEISASSTNLVPTFADGGCHVVSVTNPYSRILCFLDQSRYFSIK